VGVNFKTLVSLFIALSGYGSLGWTLTCPQAFQPLSAQSTLSTKEIRHHRLDQLQLIEGPIIDSHRRVVSRNPQKFLVSKLAHEIDRLQRRWGVEFSYIFPHPIMQNPAKVYDTYQPTDSNIHRLQIQKRSGHSIQVSFHLKLLENPNLLIKNIEQLWKIIPLIHKLDSLGVVFDLSFFADSFRLEILKIQSFPNEIGLQWIQQSMEDFSIRFIFANSVARPLLQRADGYTQGRNIYITDEAIDDHPDRNLIKEEFLSILIHEIIHGETAALPQHQLSSLGRQIVWRRLSGPDLTQNSLYTDFFRSDEAEAHFASWQVTIDREQTEHHRTLAAEFCHLQIEWLQAILDYLHQNPSTTTDSLQSFYIQDQWGRHLQANLNLSATLAATTPNIETLLSSRLQQLKQILAKLDAEYN
jgi:hypothetical protein